MAGMDDYLTVNRANWDERAPAHAASPDYGFEAFVAHPDHLSSIVRFDLPLLGDVSGRTGIHLQCHIGTDTLSLARLGARMTGLDLSPASLEQARRLAAEAGPAVDYVEADVYSAPEALGGRSFDLVYTGVGALCWLPDVDRWAGVVDDLLAPGGRLFLREGHPMLWSLDEALTEALIVAYPYFETSRADRRRGSPAPTSRPTSSSRTTVRCPGTTASVRRSRRCSSGGSSSPDSWSTGACRGRRCRTGWCATASVSGRCMEHPERLPLSYTLQARKPQR